MASIATAPPMSHALAPVTAGMPPALVDDAASPLPAVPVVLVVALVAVNSRELVLSEVIRRGDRNSDLTWRTRCRDQGSFLARFVDPHEGSFLWNAPGIDAADSALLLVAREDKAAKVARTADFQVRDRDT
ncbi:hypothetical protein AJ80_02840 [Polytolypa hystricis UAMH7299]|uniref:Uncharacterized protein n=1 Tax=Polytolypa hystricis (strain UAMH7299) TaxID=1447883 RepID=A0A2B7YN58_POLH7|nr:hypothetical protein AJ80_02840 [Polytolypa hystricis UAMH7299]